MEEKSDNCRKQYKTLPHTQTVKIQLYASVLPAIRRQATILSRTTGINAATFAAVLGRYTACCVYNRAIEHPRPRSSLQCNKLASRLQEMHKIVQTPAIQNTGTADKK